MVGGDDTTIQRHAQLNMSFLLNLLGVGYMFCIEMDLIEYFGIPNNWVTLAPVPCPLSPIPCSLKRAAC